MTETLAAGIESSPYNGTAGGLLGLLVLAMVLAIPVLLMTWVFRNIRMAKDSRARRNAAIQWECWHRQQQAELYRRSQAGYLQPGHQR